MLKKKPTGKQWQEFVDQWYNLDHEGKVKLCFDNGVSYETGRHWLSDSGDARPITTNKEPVHIFSPYGDKPNVPTELKTKKGLSRAVIMGDTHNPYQDDKVVNVVEQCLEDIQPDYLFYNGDLNDFYQVSDFSKDPARLSSLQEDIDLTIKMFERHKYIVPNVKMVFIEGTHENRWFKYLQDKAPAISKLRGTTIPALYMLDKFEIEYVTFERGVLINSTFLILHGDVASKHSAATARVHYEKNGGSGICNHTHRLGSFFHRSRFGTFGWWENGCLCRLDPDWIINPNWQHGFSVITFEDTGRFFVEQVPIVENKFIYGGKLYQ